MGFSALTANTLTHTHTNTHAHARPPARARTHAHSHTPAEADERVMRPVCATHQDAHIFPLSAWKIYTPLSAHLSDSTPHPQIPPPPRLPITPPSRLPTIPPSIRPARPHDPRFYLLPFHPYNPLSSHPSVWTGSCQACRSTSSVRGDGSSSPSLHSPPTTHNDALDSNP